MLYLSSPMCAMTGSGCGEGGYDVAGGGDDGDAGCSVANKREVKSQQSLGVKKIISVRDAACRMAWQLLDGLVST
jgi:hypothetical protein